VGTGLVVAMLLARRTDAVLAALLGALTVAGTHPESARHVWSPYHRIAVEPITHIRDVHTREEVDLGRTVGYVLTVNSDYYQMMLDLDSDRPQHPFLAGWRAFYEQPYVGAETLPPGPVLVVGAGTGNDVAAALRRTHRPVTAVEIDPGIAALGIRLHPERPYSDPRVTLVIDDARSYFHHARSGEYALVVFGFLDSHRLLSAFSSVRLDNFVYTREGLEEARRLLAPGGRIALSFTSRRWMHERILALVTGTFGPGTTTWTDPSAYANGVLYVNARTPGAVRLPPPGGTLVPTDDWPFLYLQRRRIPAHNRLFLLIAISLSSACLLLLPRGERRIRLPYFFLGAAFFLIETSNVVRMALLYGTTWWVNTVVFAGILALVLLSNLTAARWPIPVRTSVVWAALLILLSALVPVQTLLELGPWSRGAVAVVVFLGPVYFGGLIFARLIRAEPRLFEAYGSNVLGAVLGGAAEYSSLVFGFRFLLAVALCLYLAVFLLLRRGGGVRGALAA
jgi:spermidine synthase